MIKVFRSSRYLLKFSRRVNLGKKMMMTWKMIIKMIMGKRRRVGLFLLMILLKMVCFNILIRMLGAVSGFN